MPDESARLHLFADGPVEVSGVFRLGPEAVPGPPRRLRFCRCGASALAPLCDGSHVAARVREPVPVADRRPGVAPNTRGLEIQGRPGGPLKLSGAFLLIAPGGEVLSHGGEAALCRCRRSHQWPFCDGAHRSSEAVS